jgi:hypothetical protein
VPNSTTGCWYVDALKFCGVCIRKSWNTYSHFVERRRKRELTSLLLVAAFIRAASEHKEKEVRALAKEFIKEIKEEEMPMCPPRTLSVGGSAP